MRLIGGHGINNEGAQNVDRLLSVMSDRGYWTRDVALEKVRWWGATKRQAKESGQRIADVSRDGDVLVLHSFGCPCGAEAMRLVNYSLVVMYAPAMPDDWPFPRGSRVHCYYSPEDRAIKLGTWVGRLFPFSAFGPAGTDGFQPRTGMLLTQTKKNFGHSDYFRPGHIQQTADELEGHIEIAQRRGNLA